MPLQERAVQDALLAPHHFQGLQPSTMLHDRDLHHGLPKQGAAKRQLRHPLPSIFRREAR